MIMSSTANASTEASRSLSPLPTEARSASEDTISFAANRSAAQVDFPDPDGPTSTTTAGVGIAIMGATVRERLEGDNRDGDPQAGGGEGGGGAGRGTPPAGNN